MVKITHKKIKNVNLRQTIRSNIGKIANIQQPLNNNGVYSSAKFSLYQKPKQNNFTNVNLTLQINNTSDSLSNNIQDINTPNFSSYDTIQYDVHQYENSSIASNEIQENQFQKSNNYENNSNVNNNYDDTISIVLDENSSDEDVSLVSNEYENYNENILDECEDDSDENISFTYKNQYDGLQNTQPYYGEAKPYFPNKSVMLMFIWCTKHMIGTITILLILFFLSKHLINNYLFVNRISCLSGFSKDLTTSRFLRIRSSS
jgi:hypothetical protein